MKAFRSLCARGTRANREGVRRALENSTSSPRTIYSTPSTRFDVDGDGAIDFGNSRRRFSGEDIGGRQDARRRRRGARRVREGVRAVRRVRQGVRAVRVDAGGRGGHGTGGDETPSRENRGEIRRRGRGVASRVRVSRRGRRRRAQPRRVSKVSLQFSHRAAGGNHRRAVRGTRTPPSAAYRARRSRLRFPHPGGGPRDGSRGGGGDSRGGAQGARYRRRAIGVGGGGRRRGAAP